MTLRTQSNEERVIKKYAKQLGEVEALAVSDDLSLHYADSLAGDGAGRWAYRDAEGVRQEIERIKVGPIA